MKATIKELQDLKARISRAHAGAALSYADIAKICGVHASQVSRICRGDFKTISYNVVQICKALGLNIEMVTPERKVEPGWLKVEASARRLWEKSQCNSDQVSKLLEAIGQIAPD